MKVLSDSFNLINFDKIQISKYRFYQIVVVVGGGRGIYGVGKQTQAIRMDFVVVVVVVMCTTFFRLLKRKVGCNNKSMKCKVFKIKNEKKILRQFIRG